MELAAARAILELMLDFGSHVLQPARVTAARAAAPSVGARTWRSLRLGRERQRVRALQSTAVRHPRVETFSPVQLAAAQCAGGSAALGPRRGLKRCRADRGRLIASSASNFRCPNTVPGPCGARRMRRPLGRSSRRRASSRLQVVLHVRSIRRDDRHNPTHARRWLR